MNFNENNIFKIYFVVGFQFAQSNQDHVTLKNLDFDAAGLYYCEVSTDTPIFTKASNDEQIHVIRKLQYSCPEADCWEFIFAFSSTDESSTNRVQEEAVLHWRKACG